MLVIRIYNFFIKVLEKVLIWITFGKKRILPDYIYDGYHKVVKKRILNDLPSSMFNFDNKRILSNPKPINIVWVMWYDKKNMSYMVKKNIEFMRTRLNKKVILLTKDNIKNYIDIPKSILLELDSHNIPIQAFADYVRTKLLYQYGGLWLDSTIFVADSKNTVNDLDIEQTPLITIKGITDFRNKFIAKGRWTVYFLGGKQGQDFFFFVNKGLEYYLSNGISLPDYFLMDYLFDIAYERNIGGFRTFNDLLPNNNNDAEKLSMIANKEFEKETYDQILKKTSFFKMASWKKFVKETSSGKKTYYGNLFY